MNKLMNDKELVNFFEDSFRALRPGKLGASILTMCREIAAERAEKVEVEEMRELVEVEQ